MPIESRIDHPRKLVLARGTGTLTRSDIFGHQREVWSRADVVGYDELAFGLGRMYQAYRELEPRSTKQVAVFRTRAAALEILGVESLEPAE